MHEQQIFATCFTQPWRSSTKRGQALGRLRGASRGHLEKQTIWKMTALYARNVTFNEEIMHSLWVKTAHKTHLLWRQRTRNAMPRHAEIRPTSLWLWKKNSQRLKWGCCWCSPLFDASVYFYRLPFGWRRKRNHERQTSSSDQSSGDSTRRAWPCDVAELRRCLRCR